MATIPNGILDGIKGRIGNVSGYKRYRVNILRIASNNVDVKATPKRNAQCDKIKVCNVFCKAFAGTGFFSKTFPAFGHTGSGNNRAMSSLMNLALVDTNTGIGISYSRELISKGQLRPAENALISADDKSNIQFTWTDNSDIGTAKKKDKAILVAFFPERKEVILSFTKGIRGSAAAKLQISIIKGCEAETWIGFLRDDEKDASCSIYTAKIISVIFLTAFV